MKIVHVNLVGSLSRWRERVRVRVVINITPHPNLLPQGEKGFKNRKIRK